MIDDDTTTRTARPTVPTTLLALASTACLVVGALAWAPWEFRLKADFTPLPPPEETPSPAPTIELPAEEPGGAGDMILWIIIGVGLVVLALVLVVAARAVRTWWAGRPRPLPEAPLTVDTLPGQLVPTREVVADAIETALARLDGTADPADAVVRSWLVLEEAVAREGLVRDAAQTQAELTRDVLHGTRAPRGATTELLQVYEAVRYGTGDATAADVSRARAALEAILGALRDERAEPDA